MEVITLISLTISFLTIAVVAYLFNNIRSEKKHQSSAEHNDLDNLLNQIAGVKSAVDGLSSTVKSGQEKTSNSLDYLSKNYHKWTEALTNKSLQGELGEESLREMLDDVGLLEGVNYKWEDTVGSFDQKVKPDVYLDSTRGGTIVIDSKVSIASFAQSQNVESEDDKHRFLRQHAEDVLKHVEALHKKKYHQYFEGSPEFTLMYMYNINLYLLALSQMPDLDTKARNMGVIICTPPILYAVLKTIKLFNVQKDMEQNAKKISKIGYEIHNRLNIFTKHLNRVGSGLSTATGAYNKAVSSWTSKLIPKVSQLEDIQMTDKSEKIEDKLKRIEVFPSVTGDSEIKIEDNNIKKL